MSDAILVLNSGSSSINSGCSIFRGPSRIACKGLLDEHDAEPRLTVMDASGHELFEKRPRCDRQ